jgi:serine/threonine protein kinase/Tol biopolymer transport system component
MALSAGTRLGPYEILSAIGAGGMGEVYRARDTKLDRDVAIKVLPDALAQHPDRLARFEREAKVLAALNHPNIAAIYGLEDRAIVMELVEGPTLAERIASGPLPLEESLKIAAQIADALEAAHEKGIVHRDLKPANVKAPPDGVVKVLDFGLATAAQAEARATTTGENSPTLTMAATEVGLILGTAAYMSPEQAAGKPADKRADIWSFGVVLWEMLTGSRLFAGGETVSHTLADVLRAEIDFGKLPASTPAAIRHLLKRCLDRNVKTRLRDIGEARVILANPTSGTESPAQAESPPHDKKWLPWSVAAAATIAALGLGYIGYRHYTEETRVVKFSALLPEKARFAAGSLPAISPDGRRIAVPIEVEGSRRIWLRDLDSLTPRLVRGTEGAIFPFWSPDSRWLVFFTGNRLKKVDGLGGPAVEICELPYPGRGGSWSVNDVIVFGVSGGGLFRVPATGGNATPISTPDPPAEVEHERPWFLPDGHHVIFTARSLDPSRSRVYVIDMDSKNKSKDRRLLSAVDSNAVYSPPGYLLFARDETLMAQPFDASKVQITGDAVPLIEGIDYYGGYANFSASQTGVLTYTSGATLFGGQLTWFDRAGKPLGTVGRSGLIEWAAISPDGGKVAYDLRDPQTLLFDIWVHDLATHTDSRFTFGPGNNTNRFPVWSPDSSHIAFTSQGSAPGVYQLAVDGAAQNEPLDTEGGKRALDWSRDGRYLIEESASSSKTSFDLWFVPLLGDRKPVAYLNSQFAEQQGKLSPNGQWLAYRSDASKGNEIFVETFPARGGKWQISRNGGGFPQWSRDNRELFYVAGDQTLMAVEINSGPKFEPLAQKPLFHVHMPTNSWYDVGKDGRFLVPTQVEQGGPVSLSVVINWTAGLRK